MKLSHRTPYIHSFICSFTHLFSKYLLSLYNGSDVVLGILVTAMNKIQDSLFKELTFWWQVVVEISNQVFI